MIDTDKYEDLRLVIKSFVDGPMGRANDDWWHEHLRTYESLLAEVKRLSEENDSLFVRLSNALDQLNAINRGD